MKNRAQRHFCLTFMDRFVSWAARCFTGLAGAQNPELQQKFAERKQATAANKQALPQYTWTKQVISFKVEQKKTRRFQVRFGPVANHRRRLSMRHSLPTAVADEMGV